MKKFMYDIHCPSRNIGLCSENLLLVDQLGICRSVVLKKEDRYFNQQLVGEDLFGCFPQSASIPLQENFALVRDGIERSNEDLYECKQSDAFSIYFIASMARQDPNHVLIRCKNISQYINKHEHLLHLEEQKVEDLKRIAHIGTWRYDSVLKKLEYKGHVDTLNAPESYQIISFEEFLKRMSEEDAARVTEYFTKLDHGDGDTDIQYVIDSGGVGSVLKVETISCRPQENGYFWEGYVQDVTKLIQEQSHVEMLRHAIDSVQDDVFAATKDGALVFCNALFRNRNGFKCEKQGGDSKIYDLDVNIPTVAVWKELVNQIEGHGGRWNYTQNDLHQGVTQRATIENYSYLIKDKLHRELIWVFARDISERIKHDEELLELHHLINSIITHIPMSMFVKDVKAGFQYMFCNQASLAFLQAAKGGPVIGKSDFDLFDPVAAQHFRDEDLYVVEHKTRVEQTKIRLDVEGNQRIWEDIKMYTEKKDGSPLIIGIGWDVTSRVKLEKELVEAKNQAEESGRLKSAFLANMSHEIRTPLNAILGFSCIMAETQDIKERQEMYKIVETNNDRLLTLINEILDLSKLEAGMVDFSFEPINLQVLCQDVLNAHVFRCPVNVLFTFDKTSPRLITQTDQNRLFQVFSNLITNAAKFTTTGEIKFGYHLVEAQIVCYVQDSGIGITPEQLDRVFDRFVKVNDFAQGTGLGLSICKGLIEKMGGAIGVESTPGKGTRFTFTLPYVPPENIDSEHDVITVMIAEAESRYYDLLQRQFPNQYFLVHVHSGVDTVMQFEQYHPQLLIIEDRMPDLDSMEVIDIIKEVSNEVSIVVVEVRDADREQKIKQIQCEAICKSTTDQDIVMILAKHLTQQTLAY